MGTEDHGGAMFQQVLNRWKRASNPGVVADFSAFQRNVKIDADEDFLTGSVILP